MIIAVNHANKMGFLHVIHQERLDLSTHQWIFQCQHGPDECKGNLIEVHISNIYSNIYNMSPFI